ncbi:MAG: hypothetical protein R3B91_16570 [Planctomycetaceae bacterium]
MNLIGTFNVARLAAKAIAKQEPMEDGERAIVMTASIAAFDGQIGQSGLLRFQRRSCCPRIAACT